MASGNNITNSTPQTYVRGAKDESGRELAVSLPTYPTFMPHMWFFSPKGQSGCFPATTQMIKGRYGSSTLDDASIYATHQSVALRLLLSTGMTAMVERVVPVNLPTSLTNKGYVNATRSRLVLWADVSAETQITQYTRNDDGTFATDANGDYIPVTGGTTTLAGRAIRWYVTTGNPTDVAPGALTKTVYPASGAASDNQWHHGATDTTAYPIAEIDPAGYGSYYDNVGLKIWPIHSDDAGAPTVSEMRKTGSFYYNAAMVNRASAGAKPVPVTSKNSRSAIPVSLNDDIRNSYTKEEMYLGKVLVNEFATDTDPVMYGDISSVYMYQNNIETIQKLLFVREKAKAAQIGDFRNNDEDFGLLNILTARSLAKVNYYTIHLETDYTGSIFFSEDTNLMMAGGTNGTMNLEVFDYLVEQSVKRYASSSSILMNTALYPQSCVIDTGFGLTTKDALNSVLAVRKDMFVWQTPYVVNGPDLTIASEKSIAVLLRTAMQMYPESTLYGTEAYRGILCSRYGELISSPYKYKLPILIEYAYKCAKMMGAGDGRWKSQHLFDVAPNNEFTLFKNVSNAWTAPYARKEDWVTAGMNFPLNASRTKLFSPGFRTIYSDETSVLTSAIVMMVCVELQKIMERVWYKMSGAIRYTPTQFIERVNTLIEQAVQGKFAGLVVVKAKSYISASDALRGYSWSTKCEIYANGMKTATTIDLTVLRREDLDTAE